MENHPFHIVIIRESLTDNLKHEGKERGKQRQRHLNMRGKYIPAEKSRATVLERRCLCSVKSYYKAKTAILSEGRTAIYDTTIMEKCRLNKDVINKVGTDVCQNMDMGRHKLYRVTDCVWNTVSMEAGKLNTKEDGHVVG